MVKLYLIYDLFSTCNNSPTAEVIQLLCVKCAAFLPLCRI